MKFLVTLASLFQFTIVSAANADAWRSRSIYQVLTDRFARIASDPSKAVEQCYEGNLTWCGGTWMAIEENLDYIKDMGFTALWISPVSQNIPGPTARGEPYLGYWVQNVSTLNDRFGTADDLKSLISAVHKRDMYIMVDIVVNNVASTSGVHDVDYSPYLLTDKSYYHQYSPISWGNSTSEEIGWLGDSNLTLPDLDTSNPVVRTALQSYIKSFVEEYSVDGLRIDAAKHVEPDFWTSFCNENGAAGVFCMGEIRGTDVQLTAPWQGPLDSILNYPAYYAIRDAFSIPGPRNTTGLAMMVNESRRLYKDVSILGNFLENQDLPRWPGFSKDYVTLTNALVFLFMNDGIPVVYYGLEQEYAGVVEPYNHEPLWSSHYGNTSRYQTITQLNKFRSYLIANTDWLSQPATVLSSSPLDIVIKKGGVISIMNTLGGIARNITSSVNDTGYPAELPLVDILTCGTFIVASEGSISISYAFGGKPVVLYPLKSLNNTGMCGGAIAYHFVHPTSPPTPHSSSAQYRLSYGVGVLLCVGAFLVTIFGTLDFLLYIKQ